MTASTSCVSFALLLDFFRLVLQLPLFTLLSQIALTIAYPSFGLPSVRRACLDRIQRSAARLVGQKPKFSHVTGYMLEVLRWLPVRQRIEYKVASLMCRCQLGIAPIFTDDRHQPLFKNSFRNLFAITMFLPEYFN